MKKVLEQAVEKAIPLPAGEKKPVPVPICYGGRFGPDLEPVSRTKGISTEELIHLHCSSAYRVYMVGFLPGFAYLGKVDPRLDMPRKAIPVPVPAGSVGIVGGQSGIYPLNSPGGWHILGRTPLKLFDPLGEIPIRLRTGDLVQFLPIGPEEFEELSRMADNT
jgi:inhibitor of KinA